ncbi:MAG: hypothetical protein ABL962_17310, partial [Fimbriimonadaceae bacterium]
AHIFSLVLSRFERAMSQFLAPGSKDAFADIRNFGPVTVSRYNYFFQCPVEISKYRRQAAEQYPIFMPTILEDEISADRALAERLGAVIDQGKPFVREAATLLRVNPEVIRFIRGKSVDLVGENWTKAPEKLVQGLSLIPPEQRPTKRAEFDSFRKAEKALWTIAGESAPPDLIQLWSREIAKRGYQNESNPLLEEIVRPRAAQTASDYVSSLHQAIDLSLPSLP